MKLLAFRVTSFRSVEDSGWIETDQVTALIGTNESGKTNVLMPLWKLNPAKGGAIDPIADYPRRRYNELRSMAKKPIFVRARFQLSAAECATVAKLIRVAEEDAAEIIVSRDFSGTYYLDFPDAGNGPTVAKEQVLSEIAAATSDIQAAKTAKSQEELRAAIDQALEAAREMVDASDSPIAQEKLTELRDRLKEVDTSDAPAHSVIAARFAQLVDDVTELESAVSDRRAAWKVIKEGMPKFVYYSNYGNLDSEIYLPHVIENLERANLGQKEQAKARTLKVLFDFVRLSPQEILEMGQEAAIAPGTKLTPDHEKQIATVAEKKKERDILLQSASTELTKRFREWWRQGNYRFRFAADGNHFRIWVSDDRRPEDIELEARSTGLQWFFSFYLVFLVESSDSHEGAMLLLDEPGLTLHPLAQEDLSAFFDGLAETNQLIYTTHSPFMVDADHLDRARSVYADQTGATQVSPDLRASIEKSDQAKSVYAAYAAVGMAVSEAMLLGCQAVIVEGPSDQHYLSAIKNFLIGKGLLQPSREILFLPTGGVKGVKAMCALVMGKDDDLPFVLLDSDGPGLDFADKLKAQLYSGDKPRVIVVTDFLQVPKAEIEDLFPPKFLAKIVDRYLTKPSGVEEDFADVLNEGAAVVPQIEAYAAKHGIILDNGWKVDLAKRVKSAILRGKEDPLLGAPKHLEAWRAVFSAVHPSAPSTTSVSA